MSRSMNLPLVQTERVIDINHIMLCVNDSAVSRNDVFLINWPTFTMTKKFEIARGTSQLYQGSYSSYTKHMYRNNGNRNTVKVHEYTSIASGATTNINEGVGVVLSNIFCLEFNPLCIYGKTDGATYTFAIMSNVAPYSRTYITSLSYRVDWAGHHPSTNYIVGGSGEGASFGFMLLDRTVTGPAGQLLTTLLAAFTTTVIGKRNYDSYFVGLSNQKISELNELDLTLKKDIALGLGNPIGFREVRDSNYFITRFSTGNITKMVIIAVSSTMFDATSMVYTASDTIRHVSFIQSGDALISLEGTSNTALVFRFTIPVPNCKTFGVDFTICHECEIGFFVATGGEACTPCTPASNCTTCHNPGAICMTCTLPYFMHGTICVTTCPPGTLINVALNACDPCHTDCVTCSGLLATDCLTCIAPRIQDGTTCPLVCPSNKFHDTVLNICTLCGTTCLTCTDGTATGCLSCDYASTSLYLSGT